MAGRQKRILGNGTMSAPSKGESKTGNKLAISSSKLPNQMDEWQEGRPGGTYGNVNKMHSFQKKQEELDRQIRQFNASKRKAGSSERNEPKRTNVKTSVSMSSRNLGPSDEQIAAARREGQRRSEEESRKRRQQYENAFGRGGKR